MKLKPRAAHAALLLLLLAGCSRQGDAPPLSAANGQVTVKAGAPVSHYAAARFADQVSFGATPELVAEIEKKGMEAWIDEQFALPVSHYDPSPIRIYDDQVVEQADRVRRYKDKLLWSAMLTGQDQLRQRVVWALSQYITVSGRKVQEYAVLNYANLLQDQAFGTYGALLRAVTISPPMGEYLDNVGNRPKSNECAECAPNENYARELMQLFTLGVVKLNADGSVQRDARGKPQETYTQDDVEALTRALTGWGNTRNTPKGDYSRFDGVLEPESWALAHDRKEKRLLGSVIPAGNNASQDLDAAIGILMKHQNIAPFVSLRLIQHLVTSNPSPAYLGRVAAVFRSTSGDMKAVIKAVLLDAEARKGDVLGADSNAFGKMREPVLWHTGVLRGLGCVLPMRWTTDADKSNSDFALPTQQPYNAASVFSYYVPTDRAPGSNLLAPEQRLLNAKEFSERIGTMPMDAANLAAAGCKADMFGQALAASPQAFADLVNERFFRGAMPLTLRQNIIELATSADGNSPTAKALTLLRFVLSTPYYGAIR
jgi:uncharacterized protein (DUF1800 family)